MNRYIIPIGLCCLMAFSFSARGAFLAHELEHGTETATEKASTLAAKELADKTVQEAADKATQETAELETKELEAAAKKQAAAIDAANKLNDPVKKAAAIKEAHEQAANDVQVAAINKADADKDIAIKKASQQYDNAEAAVKKLPKNQQDAAMEIAHDAQNDALFKAGKDYEAALAKAAAEKEAADKMAQEAAEKITKEAAENAAQNEAKYTAAKGAKEADEKAAGTAARKLGKTVALPAPAELTKADKDNLSDYLSNWFTKTFKNQSAKDAKIAELKALQASIIEQAAKEAAGLGEITDAQQKAIVDSLAKYKLDATPKSLSASRAATYDFENQLSSKYDIKTLHQLLAPGSDIYKNAQSVADSLKELGASSDLPENLTIDDLKKFADDNSALKTERWQPGVRAKEPSEPTKVIGQQRDDDARLKAEQKAKDDAAAKKAADEKAKILKAYNRQKDLPASIGSDLTIINPEKYKAEKLFKSYLDATEDYLYEVNDDSTLDEKSIEGLKIGTKKYKKIQDKIALDIATSKNLSDRSYELIRRIRFSTGQEFYDDFKTNDFSNLIKLKTDETDPLKLLKLDDIEHNRDCLYQFLAKNLPGNKTADEIRLMPAKDIAQGLEDLRTAALKTGLTDSSPKIQLWRETRAFFNDELKKESYDAFIDGPSAMNRLVIADPKTRDALNKRIESMFLGDESLLNEVHIKLDSANEKFLPAKTTRK